MINFVKDGDVLDYFFTLNSKDSCPYYLNYKINYIDNDSKFFHKKKLVDIQIKDESLCVIKPFDNSTNSKLIDNSSILLNSSKIELLNWKKIVKIVVSIFTTLFLIFKIMVFHYNILKNC